MNNNNQNNQFSVSTSLISMFDENGYQLRMTGLESGLAIAIWIPQINPEGKMSYPQEGRISMMMNGDAVGSLDWIIKNRVVPDWQAGKDFCYGVPVNRAMTNMIDIIGQNGEIYIRFSRDIDENRHAKNTYQFKFTNTTVVIGYNPQTGNFDVDKIPAQFTMFTEVIGAYTAVVYSAGHGSRLANKFTIGSFYTYLQAIAARVGAAVNTGYRNNNSANYQNPNTNNYGSNPQTGGYTGQVQEVSNIDALIG